MASSRKSKSNRCGICFGPIERTPDYGTTTFGKDFNQDLGAYLTSHYREVGPLVPHSDLDWETKFNCVGTAADRSHCVTCRPRHAASPDVRHVQ